MGYALRMRNVVCPHCNGSIAVPEELARAYCPLCGREVTAGETHVTAAPLSSQAFRAESEAERGVANRERDLDQPPDQYSTWDEFRLTSPSIQRELMTLATQVMPDLRMIKRLPLPAEPPAEIDGWSKPLGTLAVAGDSWVLTSLARGILIGMPLFWLASGAVAIMRKSLDSVGEFACFAWTGAAVAFFCWRVTVRPKNFSLSLWIFEEGLFMRRGGESTVARFEEIRDYRTTLETGQPHFWLTFKDESPVVLSIADCVELLPLMEYIEVRMAASQLLPRLKSIWLGQNETFGVISLNRAGLTGPGFFAPWSEVRRVMSDPRNFLVDWNKRPDWIDIRYRDVSFPHLVMAISHVMIDDHSRLAPVEA